MEVFGDPAPSIKWFRWKTRDRKFEKELYLYRGEIDLTELQERFKFWTDGERSLVFLGITKCGKADEGNYRCVLTNRFGKREHKFKLFVSSKCRNKINIFLGNSIKMCY